MYTHNIPTEKYMNMQDTADIECTFYIVHLGIILYNPVLLLIEYILSTIMDETKFTILLKDISQIISKYLLLIIIIA